MQKINCNVYDCLHCNLKTDKCELQEIKVCNCSDNQKKEDTMCDSFDKREN